LIFYLFFSYSHQSREPGLPLMSSPSLDFLIPTKNRSESLLRTLQSVSRAARISGAGVLICDQSVSPILLPDNLPTRILHRPDLAGLPAARNVLLQTSTAEVVCFLDDDVDLASDFGVVLKRLAESESEMAAWGPVVETRGLWARRLHRLAQHGAQRDARRLVPRRVDQETSALFGCAFAVRREKALAIHGFDARMRGYGLGEDLDFFRRFAPNRVRFAAELRCIHRLDVRQRADSFKRGVLKARLALRLARHSQGDPWAPIHLALALAAAASGAGREPASPLGVLAGFVEEV
jgi:glycosyltransferase involved in cell wall biosynthesis